VDEEEKSLDSIEIANARGRTYGDLAAKRAAALRAKVPAW
jgi:hypothetical protein